MYRGTKDIMLPTTITGSLPRPSWYTENLGTRMFLDAMVSRRYREQYVDALSCYLRDQELAGLDIVHRRRLPLRRRRRRPELDQLSAASHDRLRARRSAADAGRPRRSLVSARPHPARLSGIARHADRSSARSVAAICNTPTLWKTAQRLTTRPVKFGAVSAEIVAFASQDKYYKSVPERMLAIADAFNEEYHELADAGCPVIQIEEPQIHLAAARNIQDKVITPELMVEVFNRTVKGLRAKTEVWAHSCWGNPSQQRMFAKVQSYKPSLETYNRSMPT